MTRRMNNLDAKTWLQYSFSIWRDLRKTKEEIRLRHPAMFPEQLAHRLIEIYTKNHGEVVLDPFLGCGTTTLAAMKLNRKGIGLELSEEYVKLTKRRVNNIQLTLKNFNKPLIPPDIHRADARNILKHLMPNTVDLCITSPPYWNILNQERTADRKTIRKYSEAEDDLGNIQEYNVFLSELKDVFGKVYQVLKNDKRCIIVVMDIRKKSKLYPFHIDLTNIMEKIGYELEDFVIWDRQHEYNNCRPLGYPYVFRFNKVHEYICIYYKSRA